MKELVEIYIRVLKRNPDLPIGYVYDVAKEIYNYYHLVDHEQYIDPVYFMN